ncbi:hypothetical protein ABE017_26435 [Priestia aryabhattai]|uniref:hypothetical protein n=1 Tax=Priestia aryabhattai TaxID=412384 RepID=UPI003D28C46F
MKTEAILFTTAVVLILVGIYLWKKGDSKESFWQALFDVVGDIVVFEMPIFSSFRAWSIFLWVIGIVIFIILIFVTISKLL